MSPSLFFYLLNYWIVEGSRLTANSLGKWESYLRLFWGKNGCFSEVCRYALDRPVQFLIDPRRNRHATGLPLHRRKS